MLERLSLFARGSDGIDSFSETDRRDEAAGVGPRVQGRVYTILVVCGAHAGAIRQRVTHPTEDATLRSFRGRAAGEAAALDLGSDSPSIAGSVSSWRPRSRSNSTSQEDQHEQRIYWSRRQVSLASPVPGHESRRMATGFRRELNAPSEGGRLPRAFRSLAAGVFAKDSVATFRRSPP